MQDDNFSQKLIFMNTKYIYTRLEIDCRYNTSIYPSYEEWSWYEEEEEEEEEEENRRICSCFIVPFCILSFSQIR